jgi:dihydroorotate dehydrogenase
LTRRAEPTTEDANQFFMASASAIQIGTSALVQPNALMKLVDGVPAWLATHWHERSTEIVGAANARYRGPATGS